MRSSSKVAKIGAVLVSFSLLCLAHRAIAIEGFGNKEDYEFPENFKFGVSTAAFQIEGAWNEGGKGESMWDTYLHQHPEYTLDHSNGDIAADSYHKYAEDVKLVKDLGVQYYRFSFSWPRLLPKGTDNKKNKDGIDYYHRLLKELRKANLTAMVTLFHWDMPTPLMDLGGWSNPKMVDYFLDYARFVFTEFGDEVKIWTTMNEPQQHCYNGYGTNYFVPALESGGIGDYLCSHYMILAHAKAYRLYEKEFKPYQNGRVGITLDAFWAEPKNSIDPIDIEAAERYRQMRVGIYAHPIFSKVGDYPPLVRNIIDGNSRQQNFTRSRLPVFSQDEIQEIKGSSDFFGLNHYTTYLMSQPTVNDTWTIPSWDHDTFVRMEQNPAWPIPGADWLSIYPPGIRKLLNWIKNNYGDMPIIITENGMCDFGGLMDYTRVQYYNDYLYQTLLAMKKDYVNVEGYFAWTLLDDFEWTDGYATKFGLYEVDFNSPERTRRKKLSADNYRNIVMTRKIDFDYIKQPRMKKLPYQRNEENIV
ncbi:myrosinase 1-like [Galleria mellonella]|uniref:beta-glucosidase n=1 Tax=Galleria mellonella TaxID=7137 RepID=A0A6J1WKZ6_GALME|nr:myrosinase 1-like [Galleria mellonella]